MPQSTLAEARLCLPPKKEGRFVQGRYICRVDQLRPLTVHIVVFRMIYPTVAVAMRMVSEDVIEPKQTSSLGTAPNIVWLDGKMGVAASAGSSAGALLVGFKGAFTSLRHRFFLRLLEFLGFPWWLRRALEVAFVGVYHIFSWGSLSKKTMRMTKGITMGNPAASYGFNVGLNPGLLAIKDIMQEDEDEGVRAYMDDLVAFLCGCHRVQCVVHVLEDFYRLSGLLVGIKKTVWVPANWVQDKVEQYTTKEGTEGEIRVSLCEPFLGHLTGPEATPDKQCMGPFRKMLCRLAGVRRQGAGPGARLRFINSRVASIMSYVEQFTEVPRWMRTVYEMQAVEIVFGMKNALGVFVLHILKDLGMCQG